jgi:phytoene synthase
MCDEGLDPDAWLAAPAFSPALGAVVGRLLRRADELYTRAEAGIGTLPRDCRAAIWAARYVYAEIGREVERQGLDSVRSRAVVSTRRKLALIARATAAAVASPAPPSFQPPALPQVQYLVDAALASPLHGGGARSFGERLHWVIELFERRLAQQRGWR